MKTINATWKNGQILLDQPADWPEGTKLKVAPTSEDLPAGIPDDEWPTDADGIADLLTRMDQIQPFIMTPEEEAEWQASRRTQKEFELATFNERAEKLRRIWP